MYFVYFAYTDSHVKIGRTQNPKKRISDLISGCPLELKIVFRRETQEFNESSLHDRFKKHRLHHEWFTLHEDIKDLIDFFEGKVKSKVKPFREKKKVDLYQFENKEEKKPFHDVRVIKSTRVIDLPDLNNKDE